MKASQQLVTSLFDTGRYFIFPLFLECIQDRGSFGYFEDAGLLGTNCVCTISGALLPPISDQRPLWDDMYCCSPLMFLLRMFETMCWNPFLEPRNPLLM